MGTIALMAAEPMPAPPLTVPRPSDTVASMIELADVEAARDRINKKVVRAGKRVALVLSGGNIDVNIVSRVIERGLVKDGRLVRLSVVVSDRPGALARLCTIVAAQRANILDIGHDRGFGKAAIGQTEVVLTLETSGREQIEVVVAVVRAAGYEVAEAPQS